MRCDIWHDCVAIGIEKCTFFILFLACDGHKKFYSHCNNPWICTFIREGQVFNDHMVSESLIYCHHLMRLRPEIGDGRWKITTCVHNDYPNKWVQILYDKGRYINSLRPPTIAGRQIILILVKSNRYTNPFVLSLTRQIFFHHTYVQCDITWFTFIIVTFINTHNYSTYSGYYYYYGRERNKCESRK